MPRSFAAAVLVVAGAAVYMVLQVGYVRPHLWPAGHGALVAGDPRFTGGSMSQALLLARPPLTDQYGEDATTVRAVLPHSPAHRAGVRMGDVILEQRDRRTGQRVDFRNFAGGGAAHKLRVWRDAYRLGVRDPLELTMRRQGRELRVNVLRPAAWRLGAERFEAWARLHISGLLQIIVFVTMAAVLLALRATDPVALLAVVALTLCAVAGGGPPLGSEYLLPTPFQQLVTTIAWLATPLAFIAVAFAIGYFPRKAPILVRYPALSAAPFVVCAPMLVFTASSALFLTGIDAVLPIVAWDVLNPWAYFASFATAVAMNVAVAVGGFVRYRRNPDINDRRRIAVAVLAVVPGVLAYAVKDGAPGLGLLLGRDWTLPWWLTLTLQLFVLLPAFGVAYVMAVHRVFAPATVVRRSVQYALARRTLALLALLPVSLLAAALVRNRNMSISAVIGGAPLFYAASTGAFILALKYREQARRWLDRRFFREAYDAREILLSLASRVTYETDPSELTALVVDRIDAALHPEMAAVLMEGLDPVHLQPIARLHGSPSPLPTDSGVLTMLRWSQEPLELYVQDERSPARRLPPRDQEWLRSTGAVLFVPVTAPRAAEADGPPALIAVIALGARRSEEPYTAEDRQLLASIAAQMGLALDVARLRLRTGPTVGVAPGGLAECPQCGRCAAPDAALCPVDGTAMRRVAGVPLVIEKKYRVDRVIGRGGMGAVYRARDMRLDRDVAIKVVRADLLDDPEARTRFRREAQIVARLQHPGIVSVFDYGTFDDGSTFLVMELVRGEDLRHVLRRDGAMPAARAVPLVAAMCGAVHAAHRENVLHRDLKPENVLLVDGSTPVKVLDFGVAKFVTDPGADETGLATATGAGVIVGTPAYMAPEQLRGDAVDARADVFSLGVMTYEMLTGTLPFGKASLWDIGMQQARALPAIDTPHGPLPAHVEEAVRKALRVDPAQRPSSAAAFARLISTP